MNHDSQHTGEQKLAEAIKSYRERRPGADDQLLGLIREPVLESTRRFLGDDADWTDDIVQESLVATLRYLDGETEFSGDLVGLSVTIARNRCRDLARWRGRRPQAEVESVSEWLADPQQNILDKLVESELFDHLQTALGHLGRDCHDLLRALFLDEIPTEDVRRRLGLSTVQGVYYRKAVCLEQLGSVFQGLVAGRSRDETGHGARMPREGASE